MHETQKMHQSTLKLKLSIMHLVKNIVHNNALYWPTTRQVPQAELLARSTSVTIWKQAEWESWCSELADVKKPCKAKLPLHEKRKEEAHLVRKRQMKKTQLRCQTKAHAADTEAAGLPAKSRSPAPVQRVSFLLFAGLGFAQSDPRLSR